MSENAEQVNEEPIEAGESAEQTTPAGQHSSRTWLAGFIQIITEPSELNALRGANVFRIFAASILLFGFSFTLSQWLTWVHPGLREQALTFQNYIPSHTGQELFKSAESFAFTQILARSMMVNGLITILLSSVMIWIVHRVFTSHPLRYLAVLGIMSYSISIASLGMICTSLLQFITGSMRASFSIGALYPYNDNLILVGYLSTVHLFLLWQYAAIGTSIVTFLGLPRNTGWIIAGVCFVVHLLFVGTLAYMGYQLYLAARH